MVYDRRKASRVLAAVGSMAAGTVMRAMRKRAPAKVVRGFYEKTGKAAYPKRKRAAPKKGKRYPLPKARNPVIQRVRQLERKFADTLSTLVYKKDSIDTVRPSATTALNGYRNVVHQADIESAIAQARFFDPAAPGTLVTGSLAAPTYQQRIRIAVWTRVLIKNSYMVPCILTYGVLRPRSATSVAPTTAWTNGLTDQGAPSSSSYLLTMQDSIQFKQLWRCMKWYHKTLLPGETVTITHNQPAFMYDPAYFDSETDTWNPKAKSAVVFYRVRGVLAHDTSVSEVGIAPAGVDVQMFSTYKIYYNSGGASINTIVLSQGATSAFTNGAVTGMTDIPDNIAYSVS